MDNIKIRYTCIKKLITFSSVFTLEEIEHGHAAYWMRINATSSGEVHRDLWVGVQDREGNDIFNNDTFELVVESGELMEGVVQYGSHRREMKSGKVVDINGYAFIVRSFPTFPITNNYLGEHDLEIIKVTGNVHINNPSQKP